GSRAPTPCGCAISSASPGRPEGRASRVSWGRWASWAWSAWGEASVLLEQGPRDHDPLDLAGAFVDRRHARVAIVALHRELLGETVSAVDLDRLVGDPVGGLGREELRHRRGAPPSGLTSVAVGGGAHDQQPRGVDEGRHLGELLLDGAEFGD